MTGFLPRDEGESGHRGAYRSTRDYAAARGTPHGAHHHVHSEMWLVREGTIEVTVNGQQEVEAWDQAVSDSCTRTDEHGVMNVGTTPATYFVVAVGIPGAGSA